MFKWFLPMLVAITSGLVVLLGYLLPMPALTSLRIVLVKWATVVGAFALLLAYLSLIRLHLARLLRRQSKQRIASFILVLSAVGGLVLVLMQGPDGPMVSFVLRYVLAPGEAALLALTAVALIVSGIRAFRTRGTWSIAVFLVTAILTLIGGTLLGYAPWLTPFREFANAVVTGGMRGLLFGVVLGITLTGLRIILGFDRPHSGG